MNTRIRLSPIAYSLSLALAPVATISQAASEETSAEIPTIQVSANADKKEGSASAGYRSRTASLGPLGDKSLEDVPYSISVTPAELIENRLANRPTEALRYDPAVNPEMGSNRSGDYLSIRGFINSSNQALDGMRATVAAGGWLEDKEKVEILSGATGFLYGIASPAGMVNYVLKRPTAASFHLLTIGDYGGAQAFTHLDLGGPIDEQGRLGYRVNALGVSDGSTGIDDESQPRSMFSGALDWHISPDTQLSFDASHYQAKLEYAQAYFFVNQIATLPDAPDTAKNYSAPYSVMEQHYDTEGVALTSKLGDGVTLRAALRHGRTDLRYQGLRNRFVSSSGTYTQEMMYYLAPNVTTEDRGNLFADIAFRTGPLAHTLTLGVLGSWVSVDSAGTSTYSFPKTKLFSLDDPGYQADPGVNTSSPSFTTARTRQNSLIMADEVRFSTRWSLLSGLNRSSVDDRNFSTSNGSLSSAYSKAAVTPTLAVMFKPRPGALLYASYIEALEEGSTAPSTAANSGEVLAPYQSSQYELGTKWTLGELDLKAALFRIEKASAYTDSLTNLYTADGRQLHQGGELSFTGKLSTRLTLLGGFSVLDAKLKKTAHGTLDGKTPQAVPDRLARLYGEYSLAALPGLVLSAGASYTGSMWVDDPNTKSLPSVVLGDIGLRYTTSLHGYRNTYRATVSNITGENYWTSKGGSMIYLGSPRTFAASASVEF